MNDKLTANQLYKNYKINGGNLKFKDWINAQKNNGIYPVNKELDNEVSSTLNQLDTKEGKKYNYQTIYIFGAIIIATIIINKLMKNK
jgi:hypothetical protein